MISLTKTYAGHPMALQLRAMNIIYETAKERGTTILLPTSIVDSLNPVVALALAGQETMLQRRTGLYLWATAPSDGNRLYRADLVGRRFC